MAMSVRRGEGHLSLVSQDNWAVWLTIVDVSDGRRALLVDSGQDKIGILIAQDWVGESSCRQSGYE